MQKYSWLKCPTCKADITHFEVVDGDQNFNKNKLNIMICSHCGEPSWVDITYEKVQEMLPAYLLLFKNLNPVGYKKVMDECERIRARFKEGKS